MSASGVLVILLSYELVLLLVGGCFPLGAAAVLRERAKLADQLLSEGQLAGLDGLAVVLGDVPGGPPSVRLALVESAVTRNTLTASPGSKVQGGGLFTLSPVTLTSSVIAQNVPDQCYGC
jgi:hypothetical protein